MTGEGLRILISFKEDYRAYQDAVAESIRLLRPEASVLVTCIDELEDAAPRLEPHLIFCSEPEPAGCSGVFALVRLSPEPDQPTDVYLDGQHSQLNNPNLQDLISIVDETKRLAAHSPDTNSS